MFLYPRDIGIDKEHSKLSACNSYLGNADFLKTSCWMGTKHSCANLHGPYCRDRKTCVIVGKVARDKTMLRPYGDFDPTTMESLEDARHVLNIECPVGVKGFEEDFPVAMENMCTLSNVVPGADNSTTGLKPKTKLLFFSDIFIRKLEKKPYHDSFRHDLKHYPVPGIYQHYLNKIMKTHQLRDVEFWKQEMRILPEDLDRQLIGQVVVVTFYLSYSEEGLEANIRSVDVL